MDSSIKKYLLKELSFVTKANKLFLNKAAGDDQALVDFIKNSIFKDRFSGMGWEESKAIQEYLLRAISNDYEQDRIMKYILRNSDATKAQAQNIYRTERHEIRTKVREWAFKKSDPDENLRYKWLGPDDHRTTTICEEIKNKSAEGVSMEELKGIIDDAVQKAINQKKLPPDFRPRDWTPHFLCRHTFIRIV